MCKLKEETTSGPWATVLDLALFPTWLWAAAAEEGWDGRGDSAQHTLAFQEIFLLLPGLGQMEMARSRELLLCLYSTTAWGLVRVFRGVC